MRGLRSPANVVASLTMLGISMFAVTTAAVTTARAQMPAVTADKPIIEATVPVPESPAKTSAPVSDVITPPEPTAAPPAAKPAPVQGPCPATARLIKADVVAIPKAIMLNRLGATIPNAFVFALARDTVGSGNNVQLRPGKRPRPIVLRANVGDCLQIKFTNSIPPSAFQNSTPISPAAQEQYR